MIISLQIVQKIWIYCAKRSFHPCCTSNSVVRLPSVRKIIDFYEGEQKAASSLLSTGTLSSWFSRIQKWTALKKVNTWYQPVQGPVFGIRLELFLQDVHENNVPPDQPWYGTSWQVLLELTWSGVGRQPESRSFGSGDTLLVVRTKSVASRPCRALSIRAVHQILMSCVLLCPVRDNWFLSRGSEGGFIATVYW